MFLDVQTPSEDSFTLAVKDALHLALTENSVAVPGTARLLLAFSGGPDSTALLAAMAQFAHEHPFELHACHINHGLRGEESDGDEEYCRQICEKWQIPFHVEKLPGTCKAEADLRDLRYESLQRVAAKINSAICLTGHTLDDQVETMLFRLFRGTGPSGLLGIPACREISDKLIVLRPMLGLSRHDCLAFLQRQKISARLDSSNSDNSYSRNFIRNEVLPLIATRFGAVGEHMEQLRKVIEADEALLNCLSKDAALELMEASGSRDIWHVDEFSELPLSLRRRVLLDSFKQRKIECDFSRIETLLEMIDLDGEGASCLNEEWEIRLTQGELHWKNRLKKAPLAPEDISIPIQSEGMTLIHKLGLAIRVEKVDEPERVRIPGAQELEVVGDLSAAGELLVRLREAGDKIQPLGMSCMVRLKKFLHTHKSTKTLSFGGRVLVLANQSEVLWVPGCGMSQRIAVCNRPTHRISLLRIAPDESTFC